MGSHNGNLQLVNIKPKNPRQELILRTDKNLAVYGAAGTGKTFTLLYKALKEVESGRKSRVLIMRSAVPTRNVGFLPGSLKDKTKIFEAPYEGLAAQLYGDQEAYTKLKKQKKIEFVTTSYIRGLNTDDCYMIVDEFQNLNFHELDSVITRLGENCKIAFSGDAAQSDLEDSGIDTFMEILKRMNDIFDLVEFKVEDIVRSKLVKRYLTEKYRLKDAKSNNNESNLYRDERGITTKAPNGTHV